jgi:hypothetical protein
VFFIKLVELLEVIWFVATSRIRLGRHLFCYFEEKDLEKKKKRKEKTVFGLIYFISFLARKREREKVIYIYTPLEGNSKKI